MLSCIGSCLKYSKDKLSSEHWKSKEEMRVLIKTLKADIINMSEQHLYQELRKVCVLVTYLTFFFLYIQNFSFRSIFVHYGMLILIFFIKKNWIGSCLFYIDIINLKEIK